MSTDLDPNNPDDHPEILRRSNAEHIARIEGAVVEAAAAADRLDELAATELLPRVADVLRTEARGLRADVRSNKRWLEDLYNNRDRLAAKDTTP